MFEHFTFGAQAQVHHSSQDLQHPSPTDTSLPAPSPPPAHKSPQPQQLSPTQSAMNHLVDELSKQNFTPDNDSYFYSLPSPPFEGQEQFSEFAASKMQSAPTTPAVPPMSYVQKTNTMCCRRLQRQVNVQLQSCHNHMRDINQLVDQMISTNSQCTFHPRPYLMSPPPSRDRTSQPPVPESEPIEVDPSTEALEEETPQVGDDEGFVDGEGALEDEMTLRRASAPSGIRKSGMVRFKGAAEMVGQGKVWCQPRMRKRSRRP